MFELFRKVQRTGSVSIHLAARLLTEHAAKRSALIQSLAALINNFAGAVAFMTIGWIYILIPACWGVVETIVIWFYAVETKGRTL
ncbi:hypothetical protein C8R46DRAFT_252309 [Mycena filopes]|nr:hypothetical protein C8R46DRAFT_252309 [Mycena filopes]